MGGGYGRTHETKPDRADGFIDESDSHVGNVKQLRDKLRKTGTGGGKLIFRGSV